VNWEGIISGIPSQTPVDENQSGECGPPKGHSHYPTMIMSAFDGPKTPPS